MMEQLPCVDWGRGAQLVLFHEIAGLYGSLGHILSFIMRFLRSRHVR